jgi:sec-independent protein translocase protein TatB
MFDIGLVELLIIGIVALVVLGPQRLPKAARFAGYWVRRARAQWFNIKAEFEREIEADEMRNSIHQPFQQLQQDLQETADELNEQGQSLQDDLQNTADDIQRDITNEKQPPV